MVSVTEMIAKYKHCPLQTTRFGCPLEQSSVINKFKGTFSLEEMREKREETGNKRNGE